MTGLVNFLTFAVTALIFIMTPGIDTVFVLNKTIGQGKKAGFYSMLGINTGVLVHTLFAALGLSLIIAKSVVAFSTIKYAGAAYLIYLGCAKLISKKNTIDTAEGSSIKTDSNKRNFFSGLITNVFNPKVALFFLAFFPQFINPKLIDSPAPFLILGITYAAIGILWFLLLVSFASVFARKIIGNASINKRINKITGIVFIIMGASIAFNKR